MVSKASTNATTRYLVRTRYYSGRGRGRTTGCAVRAGMICTGTKAYVATQGSRVSYTNVTLNCCA
jgi:hypothetical protein